MKKNIVNIMLVMAAVFVTNIFSTNIAFGQTDTTPKKQIPKDPPVVGKETTDDNLAWNEYRGDVQAKYQRVMDKVEQIRREAAERKIDNPDFRQALVRFETHAKEFGEKMKNAPSVPEERQQKIRKEMRSDLK